MSRASHSPGARVAVVAMLGVIAVSCLGLIALQNALYRPDRQVTPWIPADLQQPASVGAGDGFQLRLEIVPGIRAIVLNSADPHEFRMEVELGPRAKLVKTKLSRLACAAHMIFPAFVAGDWQVRGAAQPIGTGRLARRRA